MLKHIAGGARSQPARAEPDPAPPRLQPPRQPPRRQPPAPAQPAQLDSSKRSLGGTTASLSPPHPPPVPPPRPGRAATEEALTSLALLCLVSLLLALLSLIFLLKISPGGGDAGAGGALAADELAVVYEVTLALCALTLSLNLCCLLVCAIQFLFAVKLVHSPGPPGGRTNKYLQKSAVTRVCAVAGFFISIPVFLTGIILYTFIQFHSTPAIVTSVFIGLGIVFCGCAMVHNVFIWQKEKTNVVRSLRSHPVINSLTTPALQLNVNGGYMGNGHLPSANTTLGGNMSFHSAAGGGHGGYSHPITMLQHQGPYIIRPPTSTPPGEGANGASPGVPAATLDLSHVMSSPDTHELSTLV